MIAGMAAPRLPDSRFVAPAASTAPAASPGAHLRSPDSGRRVAPPPFAGAAALAAELAASIAGEVRFDAGSRALYATDGSNYRQVPIGVVLPRDAAGGEGSHFAPKAKRVIFIFMAGAPSHLELFDYKPMLAKFDGKLPPADSTIVFMFRKACRTRASTPSTSVLVAGSMPRMPATNTKSPARTPRLHGPVGLMAPGGDRNSISSRGIA